MEEMSHRKQKQQQQKQQQPLQEPEEFGLPFINICDSLFDDITNSAGSCELQELESAALPALLPSEQLASSRSPQTMVRQDPLDAAMIYQQRQRQQPTVLKRSRGDLLSSEAVYVHPHVFHDRHQSDNAFSVGSSLTMIRGNGSEQTRLSPQSLAARQRRKRISNKTQDLGRLVPGGHKMSTAEMFQAAAKYVKFLQAQVGILSLQIPQEHQAVEGSESGRGGEKELLQQLLATTAIQERLYQADRCIVPNRTVEGLVDDPFIKSNPFISRDLQRFN